jgi:hypothetical protein
VGFIPNNNEVRIHHCYSEDYKLSSKDFVKMILLDAIFIIQLFVRTCEKENDYISSQPWLEGGTQHDLILLENQLSFFVLKELYTFAFRDSSNPNPQLDFIMHSVVYFGAYIYREFHDDMQLPKEFKNEEVKHFTDLIRYVFCSIPNLKPTENLDNLYYAKRLMRQD